MTDALDRRTLWLATAACFVVAFFLFAFFYLRMAILWDADSYYHLAVARLYAQHGLAAKIPWARFSLLANGGDKDFFFHIFLMPFASLLDPAIGGRLALALLNALLAAAIGNLAARAIGAWGFAVPLWLWVAAPPFFTRVVRLRPELAALLIILIAIPFAAKRKWIAVGVLAAVFTWTYTAFQVFLALCVIWWLLDRFAGSEGVGSRVSGVRTEDDATHDAGLSNASTQDSGLRTQDSTQYSALSAQHAGVRRARFANLAWPFAGAAIALIARPYPIENARIWFVQNVRFFLNASRLDVGDEIRPPSPERVGAASVAWLAALAVLAVVAMRSRSRAHPLLRSAAVPAIVFAILFLGMVRMATYFFPLATLAILFAIGPSLRTQDSGLRTRAIPLTLALSTLLALPLALNPTFVHIISGAPVVSESDWEAFGKAVPNGAKIAATWGDAEIYALWAPQGRYLDVLDPIFMALPFPRQYAVQRAMFSGVHPDLPFAARADLDSDFVALDWSDVPRELIERIKADPRLRIRYGGYNVLAEVVPSDAFVLDWVVRSDDRAAPLRYPLSAPLLRSVEGFVDARRVTASHCATFARSESGPRQFAFAPYGKSAVAIDGRVMLATDGVDANLARALPVAIPPGPHRLDIRTCEAGGFCGFYLRR
jgi:hypothetical protein